jgi:hypothetical protein
VQKEGQCPSGTVSEIELGRFALLRFELRFKQALLGSYFDALFATKKASVEDLLAIVDTLEAEIPGSLALEVRLVSDLGFEVPALQALGGLLAECNLGNRDACRALARSFSDSLRSNGAISDILAASQTWQTLPSESSVITRSIRGAPEAVVLREWNAKGLRSLESAVGEITNDPNTMELEKTSVAAAHEALSKLLRSGFGPKVQEEQIASELSRTTRDVQDILLRNRAQAACESMEMTGWDQVEKLVAPAVVRNCAEAARAAMALEIWAPDPHFNTDASFLPFVIKRKFVRVPKELSQNVSFLGSLLSLPHLQEIQLPQSENSFVISLLEKSGVKVNHQ